jgi:hypothetical protein
MKAFTEEKVDVSERIKDGRTIFVETVREAKKITEFLGYYYPLFSTNCQKRELIGYGIPK